MSRKKPVAIVGIGEVPTGKYPNRSAAEALVTACRQAFLNSGLKKEEIEFVLPTRCFSDGEFNSFFPISYVSEMLGFKNTKSCGSFFSGGSTSGISLDIAKGLIESGQAKAVLCCHTDKLGTGFGAQEGIDMFATAAISHEWEVPYGLHYNSIAALMARRFMYETGTTEEQIAAVCVSNRKWANLNPNAMFKDKELSLEQVMNSKELSLPLHSFECNMICDGASAFIVTSAERAEEICEHPVYLLGSGGMATQSFFSQAPDLTRGETYKRAAELAFAEAGLTPKDIDIAEIYDSYPIVPLVALEATGLCEKGTAGQFVLEGNTQPGGKLPMTTNGGMLSQGHTGAGGGFAVLVEAVRQLSGQAGERQVPGAKFVLETGTGGAYGDGQVAILGTEVV